MPTYIFLFPKVFHTYTILCTDRHLQRNLSRIRVSRNRASHLRTCLYLPKCAHLYHWLYSHANRPHRTRRHYLKPIIEECLTFPVSKSMFISIKPPSFIHLSCVHPYVLSLSIGFASFKLAFVLVPILILLKPHPVSLVIQPFTLVDTTTLIHHHTYALTTVTL